MQLRSLKNGIRFVSLKNPNLNSVVVMVSVRVGSRDEEPEMHGASHFIEHMLFKGTKKRPTSRIISSLIDSRGGNHNAYTDKEITSFFIQMSHHDAPLAVDIVHDMLKNSLFRTKDVNGERPVIQEEILGYENDPDAQGWQVSEEIAFMGSSLAHPIAGTVESVKFSARKLRDFYNHYYHPSEMVVVLSGAVTPELEALALRKFGSLDGSKRTSGFERPQRDFNGGFTSPGFKYVVGKTDRIHMIARLPGHPKYTVDSRKVDLATMALGGTSSSRLFQEVREKRGLCYGISAFHHGYSDIGSVIITTDTEQPKFKETLQTVVQEVRKWSRRGVTAKELKDAKTQLRGSTLLSMDKPMGLAENAIYQLQMTGRFTSPEDMLQQYMKVRLDDVNESISILTPESMHLTIIGPASKEKAVTSICKNFGA